ncbi:MAG: putative Ig domain-containing protein [Pseudomonadota bacterium]
MLDNEVGDATEVAYREVDLLPLIDLNSVATPTDTNVDFSVLYTEGQPLLAVVNTTAGSSDQGNADLSRLLIQTTPSEIVDGNNEIVAIGGVEFGLATTPATPATITLSSGARVDVAYNATTGLFQIAETPDVGSDGVITQADMDEIIQSVSYRHASNAPTAGDRDLVFTLEDVAGNTSDPATTTITVQSTLSPPLIVPDPDGSNTEGGKFVNTFTENGAPVSIVDTDAVVVDVDSEVIGTAMIVLTNAKPGDVLQVSIPSGTGVSANPIEVDTVAGTITLELTSSTAELADMAAAIRSITLVNTTEDPDPEQRQLTITLTDDTGTQGAPVTVCISVIPVNDAPVIDLDDDDSAGATNDDYQGTYTENTPAVPIVDIGDVLAVDLDDTDFQSATVTLTNAEAEDVITIDPGYIAPAGLTVAVNNNVVNISGPATIAEYIEALEAVRFEATGENPTAGDRIFSVVVNDGEDNSNTATSTITVEPENDAPIPIDPDGDPLTPADAMPPQQGADGGTLTPFDVTPFFNDVDNTTPELTFTLGAGTPPWITINGNGEIVSNGPIPADASQNPPANGLAEGEYEITVIATDPEGETAETTVIYAIDNPPPVAVDDTFNTTQDAPPLTGNVFGTNPLTQDSDPDGDNFLVTAVDGVASDVGALVVGTDENGDDGGLFTILDDGSLLFDDNGDFDDLSPGETRSTSVTYTITDDDGASSTATVTINVGGGNDDPNVVPDGQIPDQASLDNDTITPIAVEAGFEDPDVSQTLIYTVTGLPTGLSFNPTTNEIEGQIDNSASQTGTVGTPTDGVYEVTVTADDQNGGTASYTFEYTVTNPAPTAADDTATIGEDDANVTFNAITGAGTDVDPDGDDLNVTRVLTSDVEGDLAGANDGDGVGTAVPGTNGGTFTVQPDGSVTFEPGDDFQSLDDTESATTSVVYQIDDGEGGTDTAVMTVTVDGANDAPVPFDPDTPNDPNNPPDPDNYIPGQTGTDGQDIPDYDVSDFFDDPDTNDQDELEFSIANPGDLPPWITITPEGVIQTNNVPSDASQGGPNGDGNYPIEVEVSDGDETFTTTVNYSFGNLPPEAVNDDYTLDEDTALIIDVLNGILDNDSDADGDPLTITQVNGQTFNDGQQVTLASGALVTVNDDGSFTYDPNGQFESLGPNDTGTDSFTYEITDGEGLTSSATVSFDITGVNDDPVATNNDRTIGAASTTPLNGNMVTADESLAGNPANGIDSDVEGSTLLVSEVSGNGSTVPNGQAVNTITGQYGTLEWGEDGGYDYILDTANPDVTALNDGETLDEIFDYTIDDGDGGSATATLTITVIGGNDNPIPVDPDTPNDPNNPPDPDNYIPQQTGTDGTPITPIDLTPFFDDPDDGDTVTLTIDPNDLPPGLTFDGTEIIGTPTSDASQGGDPNTPGTYVIPVIASDENGGTFTTNVTYVISNQDPVAEDDTIGNDGTNPSVGSVFANNGNGIDTDDPDGDEITVSQVDGSPNNVGVDVPGTNGGTFNIDEQGNLTFDPGDDFISVPLGQQATTTITYAISDGQGGTDTATVTIVVDGENEPPIPVDPDTPNDPNNPPDPDNYIPEQSGTDGSPITPIDLTPFFDDPDDGDVVTLTITPGDLPPGLSFDGTTITGTPTSDASQGGDPNNPGTYTIPVTASDGNGGTFTTNVTYVIENQDPIAQDDVINIDETSTGANGSVFDNNGSGIDTDDPDGDQIVVSQVAGSPTNVGAPVPGSNGGTFTINEDGTYTFDPGTDFTGLGGDDEVTTTVEYEISDGQGGTDMAVVTIVVNGENEPPIPVDPDTPNDPNNPPDPDNYIPEQSGTDGSPVDPLDLTPFFDDPDTGDVVTLTVDPNDLPPGLTFDNGTISGTPTSDASQGGDPNSPGTYTIPVTASDGNGGTFTTNVTYVIENQDPIAEDDTIPVAENAPGVGGSVFDDNGNGIDTDNPDGDPIVVSQVGGSPTNVGQPVPGSDGGTFTINEDGTFTFDPGDDFNDLTTGEEVTTTVEYEISDGQGGTDTAIVTIVVNGENGPPIPVDPDTPNDPNNPPDPDNYIPEQMGTDGSPVDPLDLTPFFDDPDPNDTITLIVDPNDLPPGLTFDDGTISGTPTSDASQGGDPGNPGTYTIPVTASDGQGGTFTTNITYVIENQDPIAQDDDLPTVEGGPTLTGSVFVNNGNGVDTDNPDGDPIIVSQVGGSPANVGQPVFGSNGGTFIINPDGTYSFDPGTAFDDIGLGEVVSTTVAYEISDGQGGTDTAIVTVAVEGQNSPPVPVDPDTPNDPNNPPDPDNYIPVQDGVDGSPVDPLDLTPFFDDPDRTDTVTISVDPSDLPPGLTFDGDTISGTPTSDASQGGDPGNPGTYTIPVTVTDGNGGTFTTNVTYVIENQPPIAQDDDLTTGEDGPALTGSVFDDNGNGIDTDDPDGDVIVISEVDGSDTNIGQPVPGSSGGSFVINPDGTYSFDPGDDFNGLAPGEQATTTVEYQISDGQGGTDTALVSVVVTGVNDAPVPIDPENPGDPDNPIPADPETVVPLQPIDDGQDFTTTPLIDLDNFIQDPDLSDNPVLVYTTPDTLPPGLTLNPDGTVTGSVDPSASQGGPNGDGLYPLTVLVEDPHGGSTTIDLTIDVSNVPPIAVDDISSGTEDDVQTGNVLTDPMTGDSDGPPDNDPIIVTDIDGEPVNAGGTTTVTLTTGTLDIGSDGSWSFTPNGNANVLDDGDTRTETVEYTISDGEGGTDTAELTITINGVNDPVVVVDPDDPTTDPQDPSYTPSDPPSIPLQDLVPPLNLTDGSPMTPVELGPFFGDAEGDPVTFSADGLPDGVTIDPDTGVISGTPANDASVDGPYDVTVTATDPQGNTADVPVTINVVNPPPVTIADLPDQESYVQTPFEIPTAQAFDDPDNDVLTYSATGLPDGMTIDPATGIISGAPAPETVTGGPNGDGVFIITVTADDGQGGSTIATFIHQILPLPFVGTSADPLPDAVGDPGGVGGDGAPTPPIITTAVNEIELLGPVNIGLPTDTRIIDAAVNGFGDIGPNTELEGPHFIDAVVEYMARTIDASREGYGTHGDNTHPWLGDEAYVHVASGRDCVLIRTMVFEGEVYIQFLDRYGSKQFGQFAGYTVTGPDGSGLPTWARQVRSDLMIIERPADAEIINLDVRVKMTRGGTAIVPMSVDMVTGETTIGGIATDSDETAGLGFSDQIASASDERDAKNNQLLAALRSLNT